MRRPKERLFSPDGWLLIGLVWLAVALAILGFEAVSVFGGPDAFKVNFPIFEHHGY